MPSTICVTNGKGGCGKTSLCLHLAGEFASRGERVLLVDADPQASLSQTLLGAGFVTTLDPRRTLAAAFNEEAFFDGDRLALATRYERIAIVPANQSLAPLNAPAPETAGLRQFALRRFLEPLTGYDWILIDCPPNLYACSWAALVAADAAIVPLPPEGFATLALTAVRLAIKGASLLNPELRLLGYLLARRDARLLVHRAYESSIRASYRDEVFTAVIPEASAIKLATARRGPVCRLQPRSLATRAICRLADEVVLRLGERHKGRRIAS